MDLGVYRGKKLNPKNIQNRGDIRLSTNNILVCKTDTFGGANYLLDRLYRWLLKNNYNVEQCILTKGIIPTKKTYNLAILPSYIDDDVYALSKMGIKVERVLLWIMGIDRKSVV